MFAPRAPASSLSSRDSSSISSSTAASSFGTQSRARGLRPRPRSWLLLPLLTLALALPSTSCKPKGTHDPATAGKPGKRDRGKRAKLGPKLPEPHKIPSAPPMGIVINQPAAVLAELSSFVPGVPGPQRVLQDALRNLGPDSFAQAVAPQIDAGRPWLAAHMQGEHIVHLPVRAGGMNAVENALASFEKQGSFGAVTLPPPQANRTSSASFGGQPMPTVNETAPHVAWLDRRSKTLTIAKTLRGIATGHELPRAYGDRGPIWAAAGPKYTETLSGADDNPFGRIVVRGESVHKLEIIAQAHPERGLPKTPELAAGALTGMLDAPGLAIGATTRWTGHKQWVSSTISQLKRQVDKAGFMAQAVMGKLVSRVNASLRSWDGRVFVGIGPQKHVLFAFGTGDHQKAQNAVIGAISTARDNLSILRMVTSDVPNIGMRKNDRVYVLTVSGARKFMGKEAAPLLDKRGRLVVAFFFSGRLSSMMGVVGPNAEAEMLRWKQTIKNATPAADSRQHYFAAAFAADPQQVQPLLKGGAEGQVDPARFFDIRRVREPTRVVVEQKPDRYRATITGPAGKGAALARGERSVSRTSDVALRSGSKNAASAPVTARLTPIRPTDEGR